MISCQSACFFDVLTRAEAPGKQTPTCTLHGSGGSNDNTAKALQREREPARRDRGCGIVESTAELSFAHACSCAAGTCVGHVLKALPLR